MSRIGKLEIKIPDEVEVVIEGNTVKVSGPRGKLSLSKDRRIRLDIKDGVLKLSAKEETQKSRELYGLTRALIYNMVIGVSDGFEKKLEYKGTGYKVNIEDEKIILHMGYHKPVEMDIPKDIEVSIKKNQIIISGCSKQEVGQFAAEIRAVRKPEPYKGKGIKYINENIRRKAGKAATK